MKTQFLVTIALLVASASGCASVANPLADFKILLAVPKGDKIVKWECDVNGDGKNEILLSLKSDFDEDTKDHEPPSWVFYIAVTPRNNYLKSTGTEGDFNSISIGDLPQIDPEACYIGPIEELSKRGIVTMRTNSPRSGPEIAIIYAYTIEGDHLKRTELGRYDPSKTPPLLFTKYLADNKRTHVQLQELAP